MNFMENLKNTLDNELRETENGALGYVTSGKELLDINYAVSSLRNADKSEIEKSFLKAFFEDKEKAILWLFYAADVRGGLGERRLFRIIMEIIAEKYPEITREIVQFIPFYSRWDNAWCLLRSSVSETVLALVKNQLEIDREEMRKGNPISLLAKWMPSSNTSSARSRENAAILRKYLGMTEKEYRKMLVEMRDYLNVIEVKMSADRWSEINYETVPSKANLIYKDAFLRHDMERRYKYLDALTKGEAKINSSTCFPHDICHRYGGWSMRHREIDVTLEEMWKALPDYVQGNGNTLVVADGSGSMEQTIGNTNVTALDVANSLAIYFAERQSGEFRNKYITFSERPRLVDLSKANSLAEKLDIANTYDECANTDIGKTLQLILDTAIENNMSQSEMPTNLLFLSDMEFDRMATNADETVFDAYKAKFEDAGLKMPRCVFWNIMSRTKAIPLKENELGVALVSGFSPAIAKMVLSTELDPYKCLCEMLYSERYEPVLNVIKEMGL